ncbi:UNVERIFIED_CONTAM: hypothetical protein K2H54_009075 [Gekko kuhli]
MITSRTCGRGPVPPRKEDPLSELQPLALRQPCVYTAPLCGAPFTSERVHACRKRARGCGAKSSIAPASSRVSEAEAEGRQRGGVRGSSGGQCNRRPGAKRAEEALPGPAAPALGPSPVAPGGNLPGGPRSRRGDGSESGSPAAERGQERRAARRSLSSPSRCLLPGLGSAVAKGHLFGLGHV